MKKEYPPIYPSKVPKEVYPTDSLESQCEALKDSAQLKAFAEYRARSRELPYVPSYHFYAPDGMINDPNGLCFWKGKCHMFYQAYPPADPRQHWGHAVSDDMVHWKDLPMAIYPDQEYAVFSGTSLVEDDRVIAIYHGLRIGNMIATSSDPLLLNWEKDEEDPVIPHLPNASEGGKPYTIFDPFLWKEDTGYYALSGSYYGEPGARGHDRHNRMVEHLFFSQDLKRWTYMGELAPAGFEKIGEGNDGACPYFWPIGDRRSLIFFSHATGPYIVLGDYDEVTHRFEPDLVHKLNFGPVGCSSYQAPCATPDGKGGLYLILNTKDALNSLERKGAMSVMYHVTLEGRDKLHISPVEELASLHDAHAHMDAQTLKGNEAVSVPMRGRALDIAFTVDPKECRGIQLKVLASADGREHTDVNVTLTKSFVFNSQTRTRTPLERGYLTIDTTNASLHPEVNGRIPETTEFRYALGEKLNVRVLVDKCMIEVFVNDCCVLLQHVYPTLEDSEGVCIKALGSDAQLESLDAWTMKPIF